MRIISAADLDQHLEFPGLIEALRRGFRAKLVTPERQHLHIDRGPRPEAVMLVMPCWNDLSSGTEEGHAGIKIVTVVPDNPSRGVASVVGSYLLMTARSFEPAAVIDGRVLTLWKTGAASALAADYLARKDVSRLVMVGAGALASYLIGAHAAIRPIRHVAIWNRTHDKAEALARRLARPGLRVEAVTELEAAVREADVISCATMSRTPLVHGEWLKPGAHLDLVGSYTDDMREADDEAVRRARVFVDTRDGAFRAGDISRPLASGLLTEAGLGGDFYQLCRNERPGRQSDREITLFKSAGSAVLDLSTAIHALAVMPS